MGKSQAQGTRAEPLQKRMMQGAGTNLNMEEGNRGLNVLMKQPAQAPTGPAKDLAARMRQGGGKI
jgi:hypothetical protein